MTDKQSRQRHEGSKATNSHALTREWVLEGIRENYERAMQHRPVKDGDGKVIGEYRYDGSVATKCLDMAGRHLGMFTDKVEHVGALGIERIERVIIDARRSTPDAI